MVKQKTGRTHNKDVQAFKCAADNDEDTIDGPVNWMAEVPQRQ